MADVEKMVAQLDELIGQYEEVAAKKQGSLSLVVNRLEAAIDRIATPGSTYVRQLDNRRNAANNFKAFDVYTIAKGLRGDLKSGWTESVIELVHAETHSDYLEMALSLLESAYKDAAAVIAGTALEVHVRALCVKHGVDTERPDGTPKKATVMNADLKKAGVYATLQEKQLTAWMDLRNQAAHGNYDKYDISEVRALASGVRDFMLKYPA